MLSIGAMSPGQGNYYLDLAQEDYYLKGGEPTGWWWGEGAESLGLRGCVERVELERLLIGLSPDGEKLTQNSGRPGRRPGWDLTFSAPKSVSVFWSQADPETRLAIQSAHLAAVKTALDYLEREAAFSRRGKGGYEQQHAGLCVALFEHGTSRAGDPLLHTHSLVMNVATRADGTTGTVDSREFYKHKMTAGAAYRAQLAYGLQDGLGLACERKRTWFELGGVPGAVCEFFSKRRKEIKEKLGELGLETASAAAFATLATRKPKDLVPAREKLFEQWQADSVNLGFGTEQSRELLGRAQPPLDRNQSYQRLLSEAVRTITDEQSHFSEKDLLRGVLVAVPGTGLDVPFVHGRLKHDLAESKQFVRLGERDGEVRYTTQEMLDQEKSLFNLATCLSIQSGFFTGPRCRDDLRRLRGEQKRAVEHLTERTGRISILSGIAGSGKTTTLEACRQRWEAAGFTVVGGSLAGKAAKELRKGSGIESDSLAMLHARMEPSLAYQFKHHLKQLWREARGKKTHALERLRIDKKTVLVIDEAGMVGTGQMVAILRAVEKQGGKVVLVGDPKQLQPIEAGAPFAALAARLGYAELTHVARQYNPLDCAVVRDMAAQDAESALQSLHRRKLVSVEKTRPDAMNSLVSAWSREIGFRPEKALIFCSTNEEAQSLNLQCQAQQSLKRRIDTARSVDIHGGQAYVGDRVLFTRIDRRLGVENGETGTVVSIHRLFSRLTVQVDGGERVEVSPKKYTHRDREHHGECALRLGYAVTTHKGQGTTVDCAFVLAGGSMQDAEISYVQLSRARERTRVFVDKQTAGENLAGLTRQMERTRAKDLAHDVIREQHELGLRLQQTG